MNAESCHSAVHIVLKHQQQQQNNPQKQQLILVIDSLYNNLLIFLSSIFVPLVIRLRKLENVLLFFKIAVAPLRFVDKNCRVCSISLTGISLKLS